MNTSTIKNTKIIYKKDLQGELPTRDHFEIVEEDIDIDSLKEGEVIVKNLFISNDPSQRVWLTGKDTYVKGVRPGDLMAAFGIGEVIESKGDKLKKGDIIKGMICWQKYAILKDNKELQVIDKNYTELQHWLSIYGLTSVTAYVGLIEIGRPKEGETLLVSTAAGATGSIAVQIGKMLGLNVIGLTGSEEKREWLEKEIGIHAVNYKTSKNLHSDIKKLCPSGSVDIYYDNVGGDQLDTALNLMADRGRIVCCGAISSYGQAKAVPIYNYSNLIIRGIRMEGFIVTHYAHKFGEAFQFLAKGVKEGKLQWKEDMYEGLENLPDVFRKLYEGDNFGKLMVKVGERENPAKL